MDTSESTWAVRRRQRLPLYDYSTPGDYFVTICTHDMRCLFGRVRSGEMQLSGAGRLVRREWLRLPESHAGVVLDESTVMPNHFHGIVGLRATDAAASPRLDEVIGRFKSITTVRYGQGVREHGWPRYAGRLWQRSFHDRVIRNDRELELIREYIRQNPATWERDRFHRP